METRITIILLALVSASLSYIIYDCCSDIGKITATMDLPIQALKTFLLSKYGLSGADWDPYSYLGRAPLINYPILPFLLPAGLTHITGNPITSCVITEVLYRLFPAFAWIILFLLGKCTVETNIATLVYFILYPIFLLYDAHYVRIATTLSYCLATTAIIIWYSSISKRIKEVLSIIIWYAAIMSNFIYTVIPILVISLIESPKLLVPLVSSIPVLIFTYQVGKLEFSNVPASSTLTMSGLDATDMTIIITVVGLTAIFLLLELAVGDRRSTVVATCTVLITVFATLIFMFPKVAYEMLKLAKVASQIDTHRIALVASLLITASAARAGSKFRTSIAGYSVLGALMCAVVAMMLLSGYARWEPAPLLKLYTWAPHDHRELLASPEFVNGIYLKTASGLGLSLGGAFHQGNAEPSLRILTSVYFLGNFLGTSRYSDYVNRPSYNQLFNPNLAEIVASVLPVRKVEYIPTIFGEPYGYADLGELLIRGRGPSVKDVIPVHRVRVIYIGSFTDYSYMWLNLMRITNKKGRLPLIPVIRPYDVVHQQSLRVEDIPWTGDVLILDPEACDYPNIERVIRQARYVVVVYSGDTLDKRKLTTILLLVRKSRKSAHVVGPIYRPVNDHTLRLIFELSAVPINKVRHDALRLTANDKMELSRVKAPMVVVLWGWAPFWAVNGKEGMTCPVGPYMLVRTNGKHAALHYVGWERHQKVAYEESLFLFAALTTATAVLSSTKRRLAGAVGRS
ncbi:hypothetical protein [Methanopyrus kandleri]